MSAKEALITRDYLLSILDYNPTTGVFTWRWRDDVPKEWNTKFAGKAAGYINPSDGMFYIRLKIKHFASHRLAWLYMTGEWPPKQVDHKDTNPLNNSWNNLRLATNGQNGQNKSVRKDSKSGLKGVYFNKSRNNWQAHIGVDGRKKHLGVFDCPAAAHFAYQIAADIQFGEFARVA